MKKPNNIEIGICNIISYLLFNTPRGPNMRACPMMSARLRRKIQVPIVSGKLIDTTYGIPEIGELPIIARVIVLTPVDITNNAVKNTMYLRTISSFDLLLLFIYNFWHTKRTLLSVLIVIMCGRRWIRTTEGINQQIYSLPHLATLVFARLRVQRYEEFSTPANIILFFSFYFHFRHNFSQSEGGIAS
jgi:hypothetical protein